MQPLAYRPNLQINILEIQRFGGSTQAGFCCHLVDFTDLSTWGKQQRARPLPRQVDHGAEPPDLGPYGLGFAGAPASCLVSCVDNIIR